MIGNLTNNVKRTQKQEKEMGGGYHKMAIEKDFDNNNENAVEWLSGEHYITVSFTDRK